MPSETLPVNIRCVLCGDSGVEDCPECGGDGQIKITDCPEKLITSDIWETIELAQLWKKGLPPVAGGVFDQYRNFLEAAKFIFNEENYWKAKLGIFEK
jgi:hypothetical protein